LCGGTLRPEPRRNVLQELTDEQLQRMVDALGAIAEMIIDLYISLPPEERAKYRRQAAQK